MYENEQSEDYWKAIAEDMGEALNVDTREGSVYMDAAAGHILRITKFYNDLTQLQTMYSVNTTYGDILTEAAARDGITGILRHRPTGTESLLVPHLRTGRCSCAENTI